MLPSKLARPLSESQETFIYKPENARLANITDLIPEHKLFRIVLEDEQLLKSWDHNPGQFVMLSVLGVGEAPISISSSPTEKGYFELCVRNVGRVTDALHKLPVNSLIGVRGPYGHGFPVNLFKGKDLLMIVGGLGMAPLRSLVRFVMDKRRDFNNVTLAYGMRTPDDMLYASEIRNLAQRKDINCLLAAQDPNGHDWPYKVGMVTDLFDDFDIDVDTTYAVVCGPPVMYRFVLRGLLDINFSKDKIFMSLERKMKCGVGKCNHCTIGYKYTCIHGPIFTYWDAINLPEII